MHPRAAHNEPVKKELSTQRVHLPNVCPFAFAVRRRIREFSRERSAHLHPLVPFARAKARLLSSEYENALFIREADA